MTDIRNEINRLNNELNVFLNRQYGAANGFVNWNAAPAPVADFLRQYSADNIYVMNVTSDWGGVRLQLGASNLESSQTFGVQTDFSSSGSFITFAIALRLLKQFAAGQMELLSALDFSLPFACVSSARAGSSNIKSRP